MSNRNGAGKTSLPGEEFRLVMDGGTPYGDWLKCAALLEDPGALMAALRVRLVQVAFGAGDAACIRAIEILFATAFDLPDEDIDGDEHERAIARVVGVLRGLGYSVEPPTDSGADGSEGLRHVHDASI